MGLLIRTIEKAKWSAALHDGEYPADAITGCLRTRNNELSFWRVPSMADIDDALLAVSASKEHVATLDVVVFTEEELGLLGFRFEATDGHTAAVSLKNLHRDVVGLDFWRLGYLAELISERLLSPKVLRRTASEVKSLIRNGISEGKVDTALLKESILKKVS